MLPIIYTVWYILIIVGLLAILNWREEWKLVISFFLASTIAMIIFYYLWSY